MRLSPPFWDQVDKTNDCWLWNGYTDKGNGYGKYRMEWTHRIAWRLVAGPIPKGMCVLHCCDVRRCLRNDAEGIYTVAGVDYVRRGHLWLGTKEANNRDMWAKQRARPVWASNGISHSARLTPDQVRAIRAEYAAGGIGQWGLAHKYGVGRSTIQHVVSGDNWKHLI